MDDVILSLLRTIPIGVDLLWKMPLTCSISIVLHVSLRTLITILILQSSDSQLTMGNILVHQEFLYVNYLTQTNDSIIIHIKKFNATLGFEAVVAHAQEPVENRRTNFERSIASQFFIQRDTLMVVLSFDSTYIYSFSVSTDLSFTR
jgi:hypothetical protein